MPTDKHESGFTCANCGKVALWEKIDSDEGGLEIHAPYPNGDPKQVYWLNIPCDCGSQRYYIKADPAKFKMIFGTNQ